MNNTKKLNDLQRAIKFLKKDKEMGGDSNLYRIKRQLEVTEEYAESLIHSLYETGRIKKETKEGGDGWNTSYDIETISFIA